MYWGSEACPEPTLDEVDFLVAKADMKVKVDGQSGHSHWSQSTTVWWSCGYLFGGQGLAQDREGNYFSFTCFTCSASAGQQLLRIVVVVLVVVLVVGRSQITCGVEVFSAVDVLLLVVILLVVVFVVVGQLIF